MSERRRGEWIRGGGGCRRREVLDGLLSRDGRSLRGKGRGRRGCGVATSSKLIVRWLLHTRLLSEGGCAKGWLG